MLFFCNPKTNIGSFNIITIIHHNPVFVAGSLCLRIIKIPFYNVWVLKMWTRAHSSLCCNNKHIIAAAAAAVTRGAHTWTLELSNSLLTWPAQSPNHPISCLQMWFCSADASSKTSAAPLVPPFEWATPNTEHCSTQLYCTLYTSCTLGKPLSLSTKTTSIRLLNQTYIGCACI